MPEFVKLDQKDQQGIHEMSAMATAIVREHFDPIIGKAQNDYMLAMFQTPEAISKQLESGYQYYFVREDGEDIGFLAFYPRQDAVYLSKFYLYKNQRGKGYAKQMLQFVEGEALKQGRHAVELNVNRDNSAVKAYQKMGFVIIREEQNDIGSGFIMDDYVFRKEISEGM